MRDKEVVVYAHNDSIVSCEDIEQYDGIRVFNDVSGSLSDSQAKAVVYAMFRGKTVEFANKLPVDLRMDLAGRATLMSVKSNSHELGIFRELSLSSEERVAHSVKLLQTRKDLLDSVMGADLSKKKVEVSDEA